MELFNLDLDVLALKQLFVDKVLGTNGGDVYFTELFDIKTDNPRIKRKNFKLGCMIKLILEKNLRPSLYPTPPSFLYFVETLDQNQVLQYKETINKIENIYYKKISNLFKTHKTIIINSISYYFTGFIIFLISHIMKKEAIVTLNRCDVIATSLLPHILGQSQFDKVKFLINKDLKSSLPVLPNFYFVPKEETTTIFRMIIDNTLVFESFKYNMNSDMDQHFLGYLTFKPDTIETVRKLLIKKI